MFDSIQEILNTAAEKEQEAADFYTDLADKAENPAVAAELLKMAAEEEKHRDRIRQFPMSFLKADTTPLTANLKISDFMVSAPAAANLSFADAVNIAMHREKLSMDLYEALAGMAEDATVRQLFTNLAAEEAKHKLYFETIWDEQVLTEN